MQSGETESLRLKAWGGGRGGRLPPDSQQRDSGHAPTFINDERRGVTRPREPVKDAEGCYACGQDGDRRLEPLPLSVGEKVSEVPRKPVLRLSDAQTP